MKSKKLKCRCYINLKYYARVVKTGVGTLKGYMPCPIHEKEDHEVVLKDIENLKKLKEEK